jgi:hypothetical protein
MMVVIPCQTFGRDGFHLHENHCHCVRNRIILLHRSSLCIRSRAPPARAFSVERTFSLAKAYSSNSSKLTST